MNPFHKHKWKLVNIGLTGNVRGCNCGQFQTLLYDRSELNARWVDGFFVSANSKMIIFAGDLSQFKRIEKKILETASVEHNQIIYATGDSLRGIRDANVYFYGSWWENLDYQSDDMTFKINQLLNPP